MASPSRTEAAPGDRLQKILSAAGVASRRQAEALITAGRVTVNGRVIRQLGERADARADRIAVDGERVRVEQGRRTIVLHKPRGVVSTLADPEGRPTVRGLITGVRERLYPVGRLDLQTTGLILLTNDGQLAAALMHPRQAVPRVYEAKVRGRPSGAALARLRRGVTLDDGPAQPLRVRLVRTLPTKSWIEITLREGRWHEVRRLCEAVGHPVEKLSRIRVGPIRLSTLELGAWRDCTAGELRALYRAAGLDGDEVSAATEGEAAAPRASGRRSRTPAGPRAGSRPRARSTAAAPASTGNGRRRRPPRS
jgi:23S rRNA pseudouridine2605 synthase